MTVYVPGQTPSTQPVTVDGAVDLGDLAFALPTGGIEGTVQTEESQPVRDA